MCTELCSTCWTLSRKGHPLVLQEALVGGRHGFWAPEHEDLWGCGKSSEWIFGFCPLSCSCSQGILSPLSTFLEALPNWFPDPKHQWSSLNIRRLYPCLLPTCSSSRKKNPGPINHYWSEIALVFLPIWWPFSRITLILSMCIFIQHRLRWHSGRCPGGVREGLAF